VYEKDTRILVKKVEVYDQFNNIFYEYEIYNHFLKIMKCVAIVK
jgi:hypothetical protein